MVVNSEFLVPLARNDDHNDQGEDAEKQPEDAPPKRISPFHSGDHRAYDRGDDAANGHEYRLDATQNEPGGLRVVLSSKYQTMQHAYLLFAGEHSAVAMKRRYLFATRIGTDSPAARQEC